MEANVRFRSCKDTLLMVKEGVRYAPLNPMAVGSCPERDCHVEFY